MDENLNSLQSMDEGTAQESGDAELESLELEGRRLEQALREIRNSAERHTRENVLIAEIGRIISSSLDIEEVYDRFAEEVRKLIPFDRIAISIVDRENGTFTNHYVIGMQTEGRQPGDIIPLEGTLTQEAIRRRSSLIAQGNADELAARFPGLIITGLKSTIMTPLIYKNERVRANHVSIKIQTDALPKFQVL